MAIDILLLSSDCTFCMKLYGGDAGIKASSSPCPCPMPYALFPSGKCDDPPNQLLHLTGTTRGPPCLLPHLTNSLELLPTHPHQQSLRTFQDRMSNSSTTLPIRGGSDEPDPNGDVVLVVSPPKHKPAYRKTKEEANFDFGNLKNTFGLPPAEPAEPAAAGESQQTTPETPPTEPSATGGNGSKSNPQPAQSFRASSKHLTLASKYFESRLKACWSEGGTLLDKGTVELDIADTNPETLLILLDVIHGRLRRVPKAVDLNCLTELAMLVDYFQCHEVVYLVSDLWVGALRKTVPSISITDQLPGSMRDVAKWIFISWVFREADIFNNVTEVAQRSGYCALDTLGLAIPTAVKGECYRRPFRPSVRRYCGELC
jgi:hypothetical protein